MVSLICFALFAVVAIFNAISVIKSTAERHYSVVPVVGLITFALAMINLPNPPIWAWLLVALDIGALMLMISLPALIMDVWHSSRFCRYAIFKNEQETLTLYQSGSYQSFDWQWTADELPAVGVVGFSGDWCQMGDEWLFYRDVNSPYFKAVLAHDILTVVASDGEHTHFQHKRYQLKNT